VGGQVLGAGSDDISGLGGDNGTVGVGNESSISQTVSVGKSTGVQGGVGNTVSGEVLSLGGLDGGLIYGNNGTVGVSDEGSRSVGIRIGTGSGIRVSSSGIRVGSSGITVSTGVSSTIGVSSISGGIRISTGICVDGSTSSKVLGLGSGHCRLVSGDDGTVGVGDQLSRGDSDAGSENQKLHVEIWGVCFALACPSSTS